MLEEFKTYLRLKGVRSYLEFIPIIEAFINFLDDIDVHYMSVKLKDIMEYRLSLIERNLCYSTINGKINKLRSFYSFLEKRDYIFRNPFRDLKSLRNHKTLPKNILSVEEMGTLLESIPARNLNDIKLKAVIELLYGSALRISEVECLKTGDIDFNNGIITITEIKKDSRRRRVPATEASLRAIRNYITVSGRRGENDLFDRKKKTTLRGFVNRRLGEICNDLKYDKLTSHSFRHSAATSMLRAGAGIREVQAFLGHESILSTEKYTRVIKEDLKKVVRNCHPREVI